MQQRPRFLRDDLAGDPMGAMEVLGILVPAHQRNLREAGRARASLRVQPLVVAQEWRAKRHTIQHRVEDLRPQTARTKLRVKDPGPHSPLDQYSRTQVEL